MRSEAWWLHQVQRSGYLVSKQNASESKCSRCFDSTLLQELIANALTRRPHAMMVFNCGWYQLMSIFLQVASWELIGSSWLSFCSLHKFVTGRQQGIDNLMVVLGCWWILHCITTARSAPLILDIIYFMGFNVKPNSTACSCDDYCWSRKENGGARCWFLPARFVCDLNLNGVV